MVALNLLAEHGLVRIHKFEVEKLRKQINGIKDMFDKMKLKRDVYVITPYFENDSKKMIKRRKRIARSANMFMKFANDAGLVEEDDSRYVHKEPVSENDVKKSDEVYELTDDQEWLIQHNKKVRYKINLEAWEGMKKAGYDISTEEGLEKLKRHLGWKPEEEWINDRKTTVAEKENQKGKNVEVESMIEALQMLEVEIKEGNNEFYYDWFSGMGGRTHNQSTEFDIQGKKLFRMLMMPQQEAEYTVKKEPKTKEDEQLLFNWKYAVVQGFGYEPEKIEKKSKIEEIYNKIEDGIRNGKSVEELWEEDEVVITHAFNAYTEVKKFIKAKNGIKYNVMVEVDQTNSGSYFGVAQNGIDIDQIKSAGYIVNADERKRGIEYIAEGDGDFYQVPARNFQDKVDNAPAEYQLDGLIPQMVKDGVVTKEARKLFKNAVMPTRYGAGAAKAADNTAEYVLEKIKKAILTNSEEEFKKQYPTVHEKLSSNELTGENYEKIRSIISGVYRDGETINSKIKKGLKEFEAEIKSIIVDDDKLGLKKYIEEKIKKEMTYFYEPIMRAVEVVTEKINENLKKEFGNSGNAFKMPAKQFIRKINKIIANNTLIFKPGASSIFEGIGIVDIERITNYDSVYGKANQFPVVRIKEGEKYERMYIGISMPQVVTDGISYVVKMTHMNDNQVMKETIEELDKKGIRANTIFDAIVSVTPADKMAYIMNKMSEKGTFEYNPIVGVYANMFRMGLEDATYTVKTDGKEKEVNIVKELEERIIWSLTNKVKIHYGKIYNGNVTGATEEATYEVDTTKKYNDVNEFIDNMIDNEWNKPIYADIDGFQRMKEKIKEAVKKQAEEEIDEEVNNECM